MAVKNVLIKFEKLIGFSIVAVVVLVVSMMAIDLRVPDNVILNQEIVDTEQWTVARAHTTSYFGLVFKDGFGIPKLGDKVSYEITLTSGFRRVDTKGKEIYEMCFGNDTVNVDVRMYKGKQYYCLGDNVLEVQELQELKK